MISTLATLLTTNDSSPISPTSSLLSIFYLDKNNNTDIIFYDNNNYYSTTFYENNLTLIEEETASAINGSIRVNELDDSPIFPTYIRITSIVFCVVIMCLGIIGNVMVPVVIFKSKDMRNSTNIFLVNLSVADLMVLLVCTPTVLVEVNSKPETWVLGQEMCKAVPFVEMTVAHASVLTILAISFERYYAICKPLKAGYVCTKTRASFICLMAWLLAALFTSPILAVAEYKFETYFDGTLVPVCWTQADTFWPALFFILTVSIFFFIPLAILIILYTVIAKTLMEHPNVISAAAATTTTTTTTTTTKSGSQNVLKYRKQVVIMLATVVLAFFTCLLPFRAFTLWIIVVNDESVMNLGLEGYYNLLYFCRIMFYLNSAVNPILYNIMSSKFRTGFLRLCGYRIKRRMKRQRRSQSESGRKSTLNTSSTNTSSSNHRHQSYESFWSRYSSGKNKSIEDNGCTNENISNNNKRSNSNIFTNLHNKITTSIRNESYV